MKVKRQMRTASVMRILSSSMMGGGDTFIEGKGRWVKRFDGGKGPVYGEPVRLSSASHSSITRVARASRDSGESQSSTQELLLANGPLLRMKSIMTRGL